MIQVDGSYHEGGGQILRTALGFSALTGKHFEISGIRKGRKNSGLRPQHLSCVRAVSGLCSASTEGAEASSTDLKFYPRQLRGRTFAVEIGTAGSITLLLQSVLVPAVFGGHKFRIKVAGGSEVPFSPTSAYFSEVLVPQLRKYCAAIEYSVSRRGFVPAGGGRAELSVRPKFIAGKFGSFGEFLDSVRSEPSLGINLLDQGRLLLVRGVSAASLDLQRAEVAERQTRAARMELSRLNVPVHITSEYSDADSTGSVITLWAVFSDSDEVSQVNPIVLGGSCLGERGRKAEDVGKAAAVQLLSEVDSGAPVDRHLADQLLPFLAVSGGVMRVSEITPHCLSNIYAIERFLGKCFEVDSGKKTISVPRQARQA